MTAARFGLADADFWAAPYKTKDAVQKRLSKEGKTGVFIDAPAKVPLDGRLDLPIVGCVVVTLRDAQKVSLDRAGLLAGVHLDDGRLHVARLREPRVLDPSRRGAKPDGEDPGEGRVYSMFLVDAHERLPDLPWRRGAILTTVLLRDGGSLPLRARSELVPPPLPGAWIDPVVAEAAAGAPPPAERKPPKVRPKPGGATSYARDPKAPAPPAAPGIAVSVPKAAPAGNPLIVRGAFAVPLLAHQVVTAGDVGDPSAKAVVPVDLVLTGEETPGPFHLDLGVPIAALPAEGAPAVGHFALDLLAHPAMSHRKAQKYWLWAFAGEAVSGPHEVTLT